MKKQLEQMRAKVDKREQVEESFESAYIEAKARLQKLEAQVTTQEEEAELERRAIRVSLQELQQKSQEIETQSEMLCKNLVLANLNDKQLLQAESEFKE